MDFRKADLKERRNYLGKMIDEARALHYWLKIGKKLYAPDEAQDLVMKNPLPYFTEETLICVDPVRFLEQQDKKMADKVHDYNQRRNEFVRRINLYHVKKVQ